MRTDRTTARIIGAERMRTPVASKNALAIAAAIGAEAGSPEPVDGWGRVRVGYIVGNAATDLPRLAYERSRNWRGLRCTSAAEGLTCRNTSGHGFFLGRGSTRIL